MTLSEFKAWFEGFNENITGRPNEKQWKRIKARVKDIDGEPVTPTIIREYVDRYVARPWHYAPYWYTGAPYYGTCTVTCDSNDTVPSVSTVNLSEATFNSTDGGTVFGAETALAAMGAEEAASLT